MSNPVTFEDASINSALMSTFCGTDVILKESSMSLTTDPCLQKEKQKIHFEVLDYHYSLIVTNIILYQSTQYLNDTTLMDLYEKNILKNMG